MHSKITEGRESETLLGEGNIIKIHYMCVCVCMCLYIFMCIYMYIYNLCVCEVMN